MRPTRTPRWLLAPVVTAILLLVLIPTVRTQDPMLGNVTTHVTTNTVIHVMGAATVTPSIQSPTTMTPTDQAPSTTPPRVEVVSTPPETTSTLPPTTTYYAPTTRATTTTSEKPQTTSKPKPKSTTTTAKPLFRKLSTTKKPRPTTTTTAFPSLAGLDDPNISPDILWKRFEDTVKNGVEGMLKKMLPEFLKLGSSGTANFTAQCTSDFLKFVFAMRGLKGWALRMVDASGRPQAGIVYGAITDFGDYDECLDVQATESIWGSNKKRELFVGQYCTVLMQPALPKKPPSLDKGKSVVSFGEDDTLLAELTSNVHFFYHLRLRLGMCVPSSCFASDIQQFAQEIWKHLGLRVTVPHCEIRRTYDLEPHQIACAAAVGLMVFLVILGTSVDLIKKQMTPPVNGPPAPVGKLMQTMRSFSLYSNGKKLLKTSGGDKNMGALHGMRFISMTWVILGHTYTYFHLSGFRDIVKLKDAPEDYSFMAVLNGWVDVDTFFFLGGMALSYSILKKANGRKSFNIGFYLFHRYWRLTPVFGLVIALVMLLPLVSSGPLWHEVVEKDIERCRESWWASLLYVANWRDLDQLCMTPTWYLCADFQLYIIALLILIPLLRWPTVGLFVNFLMLFISCVALAVITLVKGYAPSLTHVHPDATMVERMVVDIHWKPYTHLGPYCVGIALGYFVYKQKKVEIKPVMAFFGWLSATACALTVLYGAYDWNNGRMPNDMVTALYAACHRTAWALAVAWVVFACIYGRGGMINSFLSWKLFVPLSRMTFLMYLMHPLVMMVRYGSLRQAVFFGHYQLTYFFIGHLVYTIGAAFMGSLFFEWPFAGLEAVLFGGMMGGSRPNRPADQPEDDDLRKPNRQGPSSLTNGSGFLINGSGSLTNGTSGGNPVYGQYFSHVENGEVRATSNGNNGSTGAISRHSSVSRL